MKKSLAALMFFSSVIAGCSSSSQPTASSNPSQSTAASNPSKPAEQASKGSDTASTVLKVGYVLAADSPVDNAAKAFAEKIEKDTNGKVKVELYGNSQLGGEQPMLENLKVGAIDVVVVGDLIFSQYAPDYGGLSTPYLFRDQEHLHKVLDGPIGQDIGKELQKSNFTVLDWWDRGPREISSNKEIKTPDDLKGLKIRVPQIPLYIEAFKALGANPTPMSFDQVFNALSQHVIDAQENPVDLIYTSKFNEVQKYLIETDHVIAPYAVVMNSQKLAGLPQDIQEKIKTDMKDAGNLEKQQAAKSDADFKQKLEQSGMKIIKVDKEAFTKKLEEANVTAKFADKWAPNLLQQIKDTK